MTLALNGSIAPVRAIGHDRGTQRGSLLNDIRADTIFVRLWAIYALFPPIWQNDAQDRIAAISARITLGKFAS
ncbi:hypothetical protein [Sphingomonas sp. PB4P5]|uniref:hypothetical protein n=1 Tax=Parasphingomonas puruogangriensis TaxID=3096155 RepID=UPI002FC7AB09